MNNKYTYILPTIAQNMLYYFDGAIAVESIQGTNSATSRGHFKKNA